MPTSEAGTWDADRASARRNGILPPKPSPFPGNPDGGEIEGIRPTNPTHNPNATDTAVKPELIEPRPNYNRG